MTTKRRTSKAKSSAPVRAAIYVRMSLDRTGEGAGIERQEEACRELAERLGFEVDQVFVDNSISATKGKVRPGFEALLASEPEVILCWHTDRLARVGADLERVIALDVPVHGVDTGMVDLTTSQGRMIARIGCAIAQGEGEQKSERQQLAAMQRAKAGKYWWPTRPFGLDVDRTTGKVTLNAGEAKALRKAYRDLLNGASLRSLAANLNAAGHRTCRGNEWRGMTLRPVLLNARNAGIRAYDGEELGPADWPAIVPEATYRAAVALLNNQQRRTSTNGKGAQAQNLLTGIAVCGKCGGTMKAQTRGGRSGEEGSYLTYVCGAGSCVSHPAVEADAIVTKRVVEYLASEQVQAGLGAIEEGSEEEAAALLTEEATLRARLDEIADSFADGEMNRSQVARATAKATERLEVIEKELARIGDRGALASVALPAEFLKRYPHMTTLEGLYAARDAVQERLEGMDLDERRAVVRRVLEAITLLPRGRGAKGLAAEKVLLRINGRDIPADRELPVKGRLTVVMGRS